MKRLTCRAMLFTMAMLSLANFSNAQWSSSTSSTLVADLNINDMEFRPSSGNGFNIKGKNTYGLSLYGHDGSMTGSNAAPSLFLLGTSHACTTGVCPNMVRFVVPGDRFISGNINEETAFDILQYNGANYDASFTINKRGNIGIGTHADIDASQENRLSIAGNVLMKSPWTNYPNFDRGFRCDNTGSRLSLYGGTTEFNGSFIKLAGRTHTVTSGPQDKGSIVFVANADYENDSDEEGFIFTTYDGGPDWTKHVVIRKDGKMIIGKDNIYNYYVNGLTHRIPGNYNLYVENGILTEKLKVANKTDYINWSDFVFDDDYNLMPLNKLESYIVKNKHLPEIPTAEDVKKEGIDVAAMDAKLLQKIEELTLYVIQQQKEIDELKKQIKH